MPEVSVIDNAAEARYELAENGTLLGFLQYHDRPDARVLVHTEVDPAHEGEGLGSRLIEGALADIHARRLQLVPEPNQATAFAARRRQLSLAH